jgi:ATP-dependent DNA helicase HFM1/MER3
MLVAFGSYSNPFLFEKSLDSKVLDVIRNYSDGKQTLIFCSSKRNTETLSYLLSSRMVVKANSIIGNSQSLMKSILDDKLKQLVLRGYAFHHAGT